MDSLKAAVGPLDRGAASMLDPGGPVRRRARLALQVPARGEASARWSAVFEDELVRRARASRRRRHGAGFRPPATTGIDRWLSRALGRSRRAADAPRRGLRSEEFIAAGAPWFFTLFGRDAIWTARFMLPLGREHRGEHPARARATCRVRTATSRPPSSRARSCTSCAGARRPSRTSGSRRSTTAPSTRRRSGSACSTTPGGGACPPTEVEALLANLERALAWMRDFGDADGDGLLEYIDESGHGLANQGWKDSWDSVQWRDGTARDGPDRALRGAGIRLRGGDARRRPARRVRPRWRALAGVGRSAARRVQRRILDRRSRGRLPGDRPGRRQARGRHGDQQHRATCSVPGCSTRSRQRSSPAAWGRRSSTPGSACARCRPTRPDTGR